jgi:hypothetical protein
MTQSVNWRYLQSAAGDLPQPCLACSWPSFTGNVTVFAMRSFAPVLETSIGAP